MLTNVKKYRLEKGLTQAELSNASQISLGTIRKYEQGLANIEDSGLFALLMIAKALNVRPYDLIESQAMRLLWMQAEGSNDN